MCLDFNFSKGTIFKIIAVPTFVNIALTMPEGIVISEPPTPSLTYFEQT
jgi:hypothetical protein